MNKPHLVEFDLPLAGFPRVKIDGVPLRMVRSIRIEAAHDDATRVTIELLAEARGRLAADPQVLDTSE